MIQPYTIEQVGAELSQGHLNQMAGMIRQAYPEEGLMTRPEVDKRLEQYQTQGALLVAHLSFDHLSSVNGSAIQGFAATRFDSEKPAEGMHIDALFVSHVARGRGLGSKLVNKTIEIAESEGLAFVQYDRRPRTDEEERVFTSSGFRRLHSGFFALEVRKAA